MDKIIAGQVRSYMEVRDEIDEEEKTLI